MLRSVPFAGSSRPTLSVVQRPGYLYSRFFVSARCKSEGPTRPAFRQTNSALACQTPPPPVGWAASRVGPRHTSEVQGSARRVGAGRSVNRQPVGAPRSVGARALDRTGDRRLAGPSVATSWPVAASRRRHRGYEAIARILNEEGRPTRMGGAWRRQSVHSILA